MTADDVFGQRQVNQSLLWMTDLYVNYKEKASATIFQQAKVIAAQRQKETEMQ